MESGRSREGKQVVTTERTGGNVFRAELALELVLNPTDGVGKGGPTDPVIALPPLEDIGWGTNADRGVDDR
jgi:hypothetical protein